MVILKMWGGLGNQMFIYSFYEKLKHLGKEVKLDLSYFSEFESHNGYELENIFNVEANYATKKEASRYANINYDIFNRFIRKFIYKKKSDIRTNKEEATLFLPKYLDMDNVYLEGYWQCEKYFSEIKNEIREIFEFPKLDNKNYLIRNKIVETNSVSLHVRRGDYLSGNQKNNTRHLGGVCTKRYYMNSISFIKNKVDNPTIFIFSDDINWCKNNFDFDNMVFVEGNYDKDSYKDMQLMSLCKNNIIANSSFSWWGAWLNSKEDKIVCAPDRWYSDGYSGDIVPNRWNEISTR